MPPEATAATGGDPVPTGTSNTLHVNGAIEPPETLRALQSEREARAAAERQAAAYKTQHEADRAAWEQERTALSSSVAEANTKATTSEIKRLLFSAGCVDVDVAAAASELRTVDPERIGDAVKTLQEAHPSMLPKASAAGHSFDGGAQPGQQPAGRTMNDVIRRAAGKG